MMARLLPYEKGCDVCLRGCLMPRLDIPSNDSTGNVNAGRNGSTTRKSRVDMDIATNYSWTGRESRDRVSLP